jgi:hypothetical protein
MSQSESYVTLRGGPAGRAADLRRGGEFKATSGVEIEQKGRQYVHAADNSFPGWKAYNQMIGIGGWRGRNQNAGPHWFFKDGKLVSDTIPGM